MIVVAVSGLLLVIGAVLAMLRVERGPSVLDRAVALDIITSILVIAVALEAAWSRRLDAMPILAALALVGFISSVTVARYAAVEPEDEGRIRTVEEIAAEDAERQALEEAAAAREAGEDLL
ncbi:MAG TPA: monovalent cation/H+ antiporter complex subunit F [Acidimicrobiia bacterium]|nr:monovalent cation/H+ antiporter complex subunit F [Acidimicrobiia bacterium]